MSIKIMCIIFFELYGMIVHVKRGTKGKSSLYSTLKRGSPELMQSFELIATDMKASIEPCHGRTPASSSPIA
jgi:hypothetical protein